MVQTKNAIDGFSSGKWVVGSPGFTLNSDRKVTLTTSLTYQYWMLTIPNASIKPNTQYTFSSKGGAVNRLVVIREFDSAKAQLIERYVTGTANPFTFTTLATTDNIDVYIWNEAPGTFVFEDLMLNLGPTALPYSAKTGDQMVLKIQVGTLKLRATSGVVTVPIYSLADVNNSPARIKLANGTVGGFELVTPTTAHKLRIRTSTGTKGITTI